MNSKAKNILIWIGVAGAVAAGYFYDEMVKKTNMSNNEVKYAEKNNIENKDDPSNKKDINIKTDIAPVLEKGINNIRSEQQAASDVEKQSAEYAISKAEAVLNKIKDYKNQGIYEETQTDKNRAEEYLKSAKGYLGIKNYQKASSDAESAERKFNTVDGIASGIDSLWRTVEEQLQQINIARPKGNLNPLGDEEKEYNGFIEKVNELYDKANNLRRGTDPSVGGYPSQRILSKAKSFIDEAFKNLESMREAYKKVQEKWKKERE